MILNFKLKCNDFPSLNFKNALGTEIILEFFDCDCDFMSDVDKHKQILNEATKISNLNIVNECYYQFNPIGLTVCIVLSQSNITLHTYPEYNYVAINLFYCGENVIPENCIQVLFDFYKPFQIEIKSFPRGILK